MATGFRPPELNVVVLSGRAVRDGDFATTPSGTARCTVRIACSRRVKDAKSGEWKDDAFFIDVVAWRELAERSKDKAKKGAALIVEGRLSGREWEDKTSGQKRSAFEIVANRIQFLSSVGGESAAKPAAAQDPESIEEVPF